MGTVASGVKVAPPSVDDLRLEVKVLPLSAVDNESTPLGLWLSRVMSCSGWAALPRTENSMAINGSAESCTSHASMPPGLTTRSMVIACAAEAESWLPDFVRAVYRANFAEDRDITERATVSALLDAVGAPAAAVIARAESPEGKQALRRRTAEAQRLGIFGAPTAVMGEELFWGNDRLDDALAWASAR